ncbi:hypothetical protein FEM48_Zijuj07G0031800 [Ziziphus jujuba var. spinosa]|uniref:Sn1-specific diacylglycerol lipase beta n=1 Tax=Ziziphus jujuba var. spinosa TaxID=714518 RepID=A0A978V242_ZIZJJ|nr:hypothetical protein FEM48_Zijuj07G0031800 [Ziziphus jujuba var. spinosa]
MAVWRLQNLRWVTIILAVANAFVFFLGGFLVFGAYRSCGPKFVLPLAVVSCLAGFKIATMVQSAIAQAATARTVLETNADGTNVFDSVLRNERRIRYIKWLWWARFTIVMTVLQFVGAIYLVIHIANCISNGGESGHCDKVQDSSDWKQHLLVLFTTMVCTVALLQCCTGPHVLRWRSYYATKVDAWKAHYSEVFDHRIREALCCLGRVKYLSVLEEDEVFSVARLLGDLVAYRASGTGNLELLAGLALLLKQTQPPKTLDDCLEAPVEQIREAAALHKFAEAAYTGPLLDLGRNPFIFPCVWLYRQGVLTPWMRKRRPVLHGDNWWRGHAAAFLKFVKLSPDVLRQGRVNQVIYLFIYYYFMNQQIIMNFLDYEEHVKRAATTYWSIESSSDDFSVIHFPNGKCEAAYFVLVLHHLRSVVIAVRGTETPEDLITDGLCKECSLSTEDLEGLIKILLLFSLQRNGLIVLPSHIESDLAILSVTSSSHIPLDLRQYLVSSFPHYGHSGIVETARDLFKQIEGNTTNDESDSRGILSSLLSPGCECEGYGIRIVGHSLGGAIAALLGMRLYNRYPNLHVYAYGPLPCVNLVVANACSKFITSIVCNNEFSARLSVRSVLQLRADAITALSKDSITDKAAIFRLAHRFLHVSKYQRNEMGVMHPASDDSAGTIKSENLNESENYSKESEELDQKFDLWNESDGEDILTETDPNEFLNPFATEVNALGDSMSQFMETVPSVNLSSGDPPELYLPGLVIHMVPQPRSVHKSLQNGCGFRARERCHKAYIADRESFKDIIVSPSMFLDHLPWSLRTENDTVNVIKRHFKLADDAHFHSSLQ